MNRDDRDKIDDLFRSKLYDFEAEALPDDVWEKIEGSLNTRRHTLPSVSRRRWWAAAAAAITFLIVGGSFYFFRDNQVEPTVANKIEQKTEELKSSILEQETGIPQTEQLPVIAQANEKQERAATSLKKGVIIAGTQSLVTEISSFGNANEGQGEKPVPAVEDEAETVTVPDINPKEESSETIITEPIKAGKKSLKRWSFGMGAGSVAAGSNDALNIRALRNTSIENVQLDFLNSYTEKFMAELPKTEIKHRQPVSFGLSASYMLTPRWYLMAGLNYSYLYSEWKTNGSYRAKTEQQMHFVGLPVSIAYKIAEWNRLTWYASAGFMPEVNIAGRLKETKYLNNQILSEPEKVNQRMERWYWSVNAGTGVSYPLFWHFNAFAEVGAGYYFDNGSKIETIHSEKPFNLNLGFGLRLGF